MDTKAFKNPAGQLAPTIFGQMAFVPAPLPPTIALTDLQQLLSDADQKLGELRGIGNFLLNPYLLIRPLQRKEAIASSNIEGTYASLPDLLIFESGFDTRGGTTDTIEVSNYVQALESGILLLDELPIASRLIHSLHTRLLRGLPSSRAGRITPGEYRTNQNFIGKSKDMTKSRFNPPPPPTHLQCMSDLEHFMNCGDMAGLPPLVFLALIHYQFETIHPYPDGNGRVGRLLLPLVLKNRGIMDKPLLYMSQYFEDHREEYVDLMLRVSQRSRWLPWIRFFLKGVVASCEKTIETIKAVRDLQIQYQARCQQARSSALLIKIVDNIFEELVVTIPSVRELTMTSYTAAQNNVKKLVDYKVLKEVKLSNGKLVFLAEELMHLFEE